MGDDQAGQRSRRHFSADEKVAVLKRHLLDKVAVSELCDELELQPRVFYVGSGSSSRGVRPRSPRGRSPGE